MSFRRKLYLAGLFLLLATFLDAEGSLEVELLEGGANRSSVANYLVKKNLEEDLQEQHSFKVEVMESKNTTLKKVFAKRIVFDNKKGERKEGDPKWEKVYQIKEKKDSKGRVKKVVEKSYVLNLEGRDLIMYVPIKTIKKTYKYFGPKDENKGEVKVEKFYRKIMYGSGEVSSGILEEMIEEIIPESTLRSYNILDLGELKEVVENEDAEEIFLRGTIKF